MAADPEPQASVGNLDRQRAVMEADADRPELSNFLQMERRVLGVRLEELKGPIGVFLHERRQFAIAGPESWRGEVPHNGLVRPASCAARASSASSSSLPWAASRSICRSQASAS